VGEKTTTGPGGPVADAGDAYLWGTRLSLGRKRVVARQFGRKEVVGIGIGFRACNFPASVGDHPNDKFGVERKTDWLVVHSAQIAESLFRIHLDLCHITSQFLFVCVTCHRAGDPIIGVNRLWSQQSSNDDRFIISSIYGFFGALFPYHTDALELGDSWSLVCTRDVYSLLAFNLAGCFSKCNK